MNQKERKYSKKNDGACWKDEKEPTSKSSQWLNPVQFEQQNNDKINIHVSIPVLIKKLDEYMRQNKRIPIKICSIMETKLLLRQTAQ